MNNLLTPTDPTGNYNFWLPAGTWNLAPFTTFAGIPGAPALEGAYQSVTVLPNIDPTVNLVIPVALTLTYTTPTVVTNGTTVTLSGQVVDQDGNPVGAAGVTLSLGTQSCVAWTGQTTGIATCQIQVAQTVGPVVGTETLLQDALYDPSVMVPGYVQGTPTTPTINNIPTTPVYGGGFTPVVVTNGDGTKSVTSSTLGVCTVTDGVVNFVGVGTCTLTAHVAAGTVYAAADGAPQSFTVGKSPVIAIEIGNIPASGTYGGTLVPVITEGHVGPADSDGTASVTSSTPIVCTDTGPGVGTVNYVGVGTCTLTAHITAGTNYTATDGPAQSFNVDKAPQTVSFTTSPPGPTTTAGVLYDPVSATATGGATSLNGGVALSIDPATSANCYLSQSTIHFGDVTAYNYGAYFVNGGDCVIDATAPANANYLAAPQVQQIIPGAQAITFTSTPVAPTVGVPYTVTATGGLSGNPVTFTIDSTSTNTCSVAGATVTFLTPGTCTIDANQAGIPDYYLAAPQVSQSFTVASAVTTTTVPSAPQSPLAISGNASATVCWTAPTDNGGSPITGYVIVSTPGHITATASAKSICATVPGLTNGTSYTFTVAANNTVGAGPPSLPSNSVTPRAPGYWEVASDGGIFTFGGLGFFGSMGGSHINQPIVGMVPAPDGRGYWEVAADGGVFTFGSASFYGSAVGSTRGVPVVGMAVTHDGRGYWLVTALGTVIPFGDAHNYGSMTGQRLNQPIVGMAAAPGDAGYWLVASDGGVFAFGSAPFAGSMGGTHLNQPIVGITADPSSPGYWLVASDGGVFTFGGARFYGSAVGSTRGVPVVGLSTTPDGAGYWEDDANGAIYPFGNAVGYGSMAGHQLVRPMIGLG
jgi:hypothetical protein